MAHIIGADTTGLNLVADGKHDRRAFSVQTRRLRDVATYHREEMGMPEFIAERILLLAPSMQEVRVRLCWPSMQENGACKCEVKLEGLACREPPPGYGIDAFQAIGHAIANADVWITTLPECKAGLLFHPDGSPYGPVRSP